MKNHPQIFKNNLFMKKPSTNLQKDNIFIKSQPKTFKKQRFQQNPLKTFKRQKKQTNQTNRCFRGLQPFPTTKLKTSRTLFVFLFIFAFFEGFSMDFAEIFVFWMFFYRFCWNISLFYWFWLNIGSGSRWPAMKYWFFEGLLMVLDENVGFFHGFWLDSNTKPQSQYSNVSSLT